MNRKKTKCFHRIHLYSDVLLQTASTYRYPTTEKSRHLPYVLLFARIRARYLPIVLYKSLSFHKAGEAVSFSCRISSHTCPIRFCWPLIRYACLANCNVRRAVSFLSFLHAEILLMYSCTMLWSSRQVVYTSGSNDFTDKSYNSFVVSVEISVDF
jgi:hypothetical protein